MTVTARAVRPRRSAATAGSPRAPRSKYGNRKVEQDGITFDSLKEMRRWNELVLLQRAGVISELRRQVAYELVPSVILDGRKQRPVSYVADFQYRENGVLVTEDSKGFRTPEYRIKRKLMAHVHGIEIRET